MPVKNMDKDFIGNLKNLPRTGWLLRGIPKTIAETVAEHTFEAAIIALALTKSISRKHKNINPFKVLAMTLIHDLAEAYIGDIIKSFSSRIGDLKKEIEKEVFIKNLKKVLPVELFEEYIENKSIEAQIARISDLIATYVQGLRYKNQGYDVDEIINNTLNEAMMYAKKIGVRNELENLLRYLKEALGTEKLTARES